jgi:hypothetical protein
MWLVLGFLVLKNSPHSENFAFLQYESRVFFFHFFWAMHKAILTGMMKHLTSMRMNETFKNMDETPIIHPK